MLGLFVEQDENLIMVAEGFSKNIFNPKITFFNTYHELKMEQLDFLIDMAQKSVSSKYRVLAYCKRDIDIIQDIQKETAGLIFQQFRY